MSDIHYLYLNTWAGARSYACRIVGETPTKYRIICESSVFLPGRRWKEAGSEFLVPKSAVTIVERRPESQAYEGHVYGYVKPQEQKP